MDDSVHYALCIVEQTHGSHVTAGDLLLDLGVCPPFLAWLEDCLRGLDGVQRFCGFLVDAATTRYIGPPTRPSFSICLSSTSDGTVTVK